MQLETADFAPNAATWRKWTTRLWFWPICSNVYLKTRRHPPNQKHII